MASGSLTGCNEFAPSGSDPAAIENVTAPLKLTGLVVDEAEILTEDQEKGIILSIKSLQDDTLVQMVVVTTPSLEGEAIEDYSLALGNGWGVGHKDRDDGLLLVLAPNEKQVRIEVGRGLEKQVSDVFAASVIEKMIPYFREGSYVTGIEVGVGLLSQKLRNTHQKKAA